MIAQVLVYGLIGVCIGFDIKSHARVTKLWTYDDESSWPGHQCHSGGHRQSPIDIRTEDVTIDYEEKFIRNGPIRCVGYSGVLLTGMNNGLTVQFSTDGDMTIHPLLSGGPLKHIYRLEQLHFHWLSEHAINGRKFPMEIHLVHVRADLNVSEALKQSDGLAIIAIFCNVQTVLSKEQAFRVGEIMDIVPMLLDTGKMVSGVVLNLTRLIAPSKQDYYAYEGSLTSPECNEAVIWIIHESPIAISDDQYRLFGKIGISRHNFRSLQPLHRHDVYRTRPMETSILSANIVSHVTDFFTNVKEFFHNVTRYIRELLAPPTAPPSTPLPVETDATIAEEYGTTSNQQ